LNAHRRRPARSNNPFDPYTHQPDFSIAAP
jgi:hypothetical protein